MSASDLPMRFDFEVPPDGRLEVPVPLPTGSRVTVYVVEQRSAELADLLTASLSSTEFWNNRLDDEDWNDA